MPTKQTLVLKLTTRPLPRNFTVRELDALMGKCNCEKYQGGRGSGIGYRHVPTGRAIQFDAPHPGKELYLYQVKAVIAFLTEIGEI
ncbi:MAG: type II toxin-antitoxin system HicA family toxin [Oscillospiraceae bacterium]|nr:type II toxin-antitoxin system HicA family toxin [Oscillospiraceae bacterium]